MTVNRRDWMKAAGAATLAGLAPQADATAPATARDLDHSASAAAIAGATRFRPVRTLNGWTLPYRMSAGVKVRDDLAPGDYRDPGWYRAPAGSTAARVSTDPNFGHPIRRPLA